ncbi:hypothetical protein [Helicobacter sp. MIT 05-5294]|uniref:hypothetical protein n=1 Tax=Helicobacter sp. MIT 05-5294 TaxID=1548150 RepID=UPI00051F9398|nr:hypothetical protein [Helicobacter sp. MIT 05-5294]TLD88128.1 hypothetical protein LS69_002380 [Helicobacter sp. MIT 05-5294]
MIGKVATPIPTKLEVENATTIKLDQKILQDYKANAPQRENKIAEARAAEAQAQEEREAKIAQTKARVDNILGLHSKLVEGVGLQSNYGLNAQKLNYFTENLHSTSVTHNSLTKEMQYNFSGYATYSEDREIENAGAMPSYFNAKGVSKYLDTPVGQMEVFLDLDDDNDLYSVGSLDYVGQLINLDINQDGILNSDDDFFDKIKLRGYNSSGEEIVLKLTDLYNSLDLTQFVDTKQNGTSLFRPELSYKQINEEQQKNFREMFKNNADESGWIDFRKTYRDEGGLEQLVYGDLMNSLNLAYNKKGINGVDRLEVLRFNAYDGRNGDLSKNYIIDKKERFAAMYQDYYGGGNKLAIEREFQTITGMKFSEEKFNEFYNGLNNAVTATKYANALQDTDSVVAMKLNDNGMITFKFDSGRSIEVAFEDLYVSDGEFNVTSKGEQTSIMSETTSLSDEELNKLDFMQIGVQTYNEVLSLADLGIEFIQKEMFKSGKIGFVLTKGDDTTLIASDLYKIQSVEDMVKFAELEEKDKLRATKFEKEA